MQDDQITYFEFTTTLAFLWFAEQNVDIAIMEVGMGGRLDATNVITPLVSVITNISIDHQEHLGNTISSIAREKAGIIKCDVPVICGPLVDDAKAVVGSMCMQNKAISYSCNTDFSCTVAVESTLLYEGISTQITGISLNLSGQFQRENTSIALAAIEILRQKDFDISDDSIRDGVAHVHWPGRLEFLEIKNNEGHPKRFLLDGAHNKAGIIALLDTLQNQYSYNKLIVVWASMADKDFAACLSFIMQFADIIIFNMPDKNRSATVEQLKECLNSTQLASAVTHENVNDAVIAAMKLATVDDLICIAGSLYLVGYARLFLCGEIVNG